MINVLIVEDEMLVRLGMKMCLDEFSASMKVQEACSGAKEAIEYLKKNPIDILLTDIGLVGMSGLELIEMVKPIYPHLLIVVLSCYEDFSYARRAYDLGVDKYLLKHELVENDLPRLLLAVYEKKRNRNTKIQEAEIVIRKKEEIVLESGKYKIGCLHLCQRGEKQRVESYEMNYYIVGEILQEILNINHLGESYLRHETELFCIFRFDENETEKEMDNKIRNFYENAKKNIGNVFDKEVYMGVSMHFYDLLEVNSHFKAAQKYLGHMFYYEKGTLLMLPGGVYEKKEPTVFFTDMQLLMTREGCEDLRHSLTAYFEQQKNHWTPIEEVKVEVVRFVHEVSSYLEKTYGLKMESVFGEGEEPNYICVEKFLFSGDLKEWMWNLVDTVLEYLELQRSKESSIYRIRQYIEVNYNKPMNLSDIAKEFHMNTAYFCQYFKKETGITFIRYLNEFRMERAKELLYATDDTVEVIAEKVGIENTNYFFRLFKKMTGVTAGEYKKQKLRNEKQ